MMRSLVLPLATAASLLAGPAAACLEIVSPPGEARAFEEADMVVRVEALTETYLSAPHTPSLKVGIATGRVVETLKGRVAKDSVIVYRVVDGEGVEPSCPARRATRPGGVYKLYLKYVADWGPPVILLPTD